ncbi:enoyl-CoA hydratase/isomerase family protein [Streptomyces sp. NPDC001118]
MTTDPEPPVLSGRRGQIAVLTLNRPASANALNIPLRRELAARIDELGADPTVRAVVITGSGRHFCAGADLRERRAGAVPRHGYAIGFDRLPKPAIAAINGAAMGGGCELALTCDFRFIADDAEIGLTEARFGALPLGGRTARLPRIVGLTHAKRLIYTGDPVNAAEAYRIGLADRVLAPDRLLDAAVEFAEHLAERPAYVLSTAKALLNMALEVDVSTAVELEQRMVRSLASREERAEARAEAAARHRAYAALFGPDTAAGSEDSEER